MKIQNAFEAHEAFLKKGGLWTSMQNWWQSMSKGADGSSAEIHGSCKNNYSE